MAEERVQWFWRSDPDPFTKDQFNQWIRYSDVENSIIEEAFSVSKKPQVLLDDYHIDFEHRMQISNDDASRQRPVKRVTMKRNDERLREARFTANPVVPSSSFHHLVGYKRIFTDSFVERFGLSQNVDWDERKRELVEKTMTGIVIEGKLAGKHCEAKWIVEQLEKVKEKSKGEIGACCVYLYTLESFLYKLVNQTMRLIGDRQHEHIWKDRVDTLGPFTFLLNYYLSYENVTHRTSAAVYRGAQLSKEMIDEYRQAAHSKDARRSFQAFTSCSRNRQKAEQFGNVLFILKPKHRTSYRTLNMNITALSAYPTEEEVLIRPGRSFEVESVEELPEKTIITLILISTADKN